MGNLGENIYSQFSMYEDEVNKCSSYNVFFIWSVPALEDSGRFARGSVKDD